MGAQRGFCGHNLKTRCPECWTKIPDTKLLFISGFIDQELFFDSANFTISGKFCTFTKMAKTRTFLSLFIVETFLVVYYSRNGKEFRCPGFGSVRSIVHSSYECCCALDLHLLKKNQRSSGKIEFKQRHKQRQRQPELFGPRVFLGRGRALNFSTNKTPTRSRDLTHKTTRARRHFPG